MKFEHEIAGILAIAALMLLALLILAVVVFGP